MLKLRIAHNNILYQKQFIGPATSCVLLAKTYGLPDCFAVMVGGEMKQILRALIFGRFLSTGSKKLRAAAAKPNDEDLGFIAKLAEDERIKPVIEKTYLLERKAEAFRYAGEGHAKGKVVIVV